MEEKTQYPIIYQYSDHYGIQLEKNGIIIYQQRNVINEGMVVALCDRIIQLENILKEIV